MAGHDKNNIAFRADSKYRKSLRNLRTLETDTGKALQLSKHGFAQEVHNIMFQLLYWFVFLV